MRNKAIRQAAADRRVKLWEVAERLHLQDSAFSKKLRHELPEDEQTQILCIINEIATERGSEE